MRKRKNRQKIFCIGFAFCLWISGFTMVSADNASGMDKSYIKNFTCTNNIGNTKIELNVSADVWSDGPYAQINKIIGNDLNVTSDIPYIEFEDYNIDVWSAEGTYPTTRLFYTYNGTLKVKVTDATPTVVIEELEKEGFCGGEPVSGRTVVCGLGADQSYPDTGGRNGLCHPGKLRNRHGRGDAT